YKLVRRSLAPNEFYDLREDPDELVNRYNDPKLQAQIRAMESRMLDWYLTTSDIVPTEENSRGL
ncbi:MAG: sulfatase, partial [Christensenellaceae bacterium]